MPFAGNRFTEAAGYYQKVLDAKNSDFYDSSLYKRGWALYRASDFEGALPLFFQFAEKIMVKPKKSKQEEAKLQDSLRGHQPVLHDDGRPEVGGCLLRESRREVLRVRHLHQSGAGIHAKRQFSNAAETYSRLHQPPSV
jgi:hypothetical protein